MLNVGDEVNVKIIGVKDGKISLSMKALEEEKKEEEEIHVEIPKAEEIGTSLGDLFKGLKLVKLGFNLLTGEAASQSLKETIDKASCSGSIP